MNRWFKVALSVFAGILVLNLILGLFNSIGYRMSPTINSVNEQYNTLNSGYMSESTSLQQGHMMKGMRYHLKGMGMRRN